jgi:pSer/pThr/pTyr-binding forkhead associated (FHA) protein
MHPSPPDDAGTPHAVHAFQGEPVSPPPNAYALPPAAATTVAMRSPSPMRPRLVLIARDGGEGPTYNLGETTDLGRSEGDIVIADDRYVSPRHARISFQGGSYFLRDLGSTNGIFVRIPFATHDIAYGPGQANQTGQAGQAGQAGLTGQAGQGQANLAANANASLGSPSAQLPNSEQALGDQELFLVGQQVLRFEVVKHAEEGFGMASENGTLLFGTPAAPRYARLSQRTVEGVVRDVFHLRKGETVIGRESGDVVFTDDPFLSRRHAVVRIQSGGTGNRTPRRFALADLGSSNGTFLQIREEVRLRHGDHFRIGQQLFRFDVDTSRAGA